MIHTRTPLTGVSRYLNLLTRRKSAFSLPQGRLITPIHVKFGTAEGHVLPLGRAKYFTPIGARDESAAPNGKNVHFW